MVEVILQNKTQKALDHIGMYHKSSFDDIIRSLQYLEQEGRNWDKMKHIGDGIKRLRVRRRRILCTFDECVYVGLLLWKKIRKKTMIDGKNYILRQI